MRHLLRYRPLCRLGLTRLYSAFLLRLQLVRRLGLRLPELALLRLLVALL